MRRISFIIISTVFLLSNMLILFSCISRKWWGEIKNNTKDTLVFIPTESKSFDCEEFNDYLTNSGSVENEYTMSKRIKIDRKYNLTSIKEWYITPPDSTVQIDLIRIFALPMNIYRDTCYIFAIKWTDIKKYPLSTIKEKQLYEIRPINKNSFPIYEYNTATIQ